MNKLQAEAEAFINNAYKDNPTALFFKSNEGFPLKDVLKIMTEFAAREHRKHTLLFLDFIDEDYVRIVSNGYRTKADEENIFGRMYTIHELYAIYLTSIIEP